MNEDNLDGLPGPTYTQSGLSYGNEASIANQNMVSNPQKAALQSLAKMKFMMNLGVGQIVMPPQERPLVEPLREIGFEGGRETILNEAKRRAPWIFPYISSSACMWTANAATVTPSIDTGNKVHFTPANLISKFHRSIEAKSTSQLLKAIFPNPVFFEHHDPLPSHPLFADEGAANHLRFCERNLKPGIHLFIYGHDPEDEGENKPKKYPARQSLQASLAIARKHKIFEKQVLFAKQNAYAIDSGVFHNDVISMAHFNYLFYHEKAFDNPKKLLEDLNKKMNDYCDTSLRAIEVTEEEVHLEDAVKSYLFNSQIISLPDGSMTLIAPSECLEIESTKQFLSNLSARSDNPINDVHFIDLKQSMKNGGGPACLRLRVPLNQNEVNAMNQGARLTESLYNELVNWVKSHYRDRLTPLDLLDPNLWDESERALDEISQILKLGSVYDFQKI